MIVRDVLPSPDDRERFIRGMLRRASCVEMAFTLDRIDAITSRLRDESNLAAADELDVLYGEIWPRYVEAAEFLIDMDATIRDGG